MKQESLLRPLSTALAVIVLFISAPIWAAAESAPRCESLFTSQNETPALQIDPNQTLEKLEDRFGGKVELKASQSESGLYFLELFDPRSGELLGELNYRYVANEKKLNIVWMEAVVKEIGISETLIALALSRYPETRVIHTRALLDTNEKIVKTALAKGASIEDAIKTTPAYKVRKKLGFDRIVLNSINSEFGFESMRSR